MPGVSDFFQPPRCAFFFAAAFNAYVGISGMNYLTRKKTILLTLFGLFLTIMAVWQIAQQSKENKENRQLMEKIAIANGIEPERDSESIALQVLKRQLGAEAIKLSEDIFIFLSNHNTTPSIETLQKLSTEEITQKFQDDNRKLMSQFDLTYSTKALSLIDRLQKIKFTSYEQTKVVFFRHPSGALGIREVANTLGAIGHTLISE